MVRQMKYEGGANPREGIIENVFEAILDSKILVLRTTMRRLIFFLGGD